MLKVLEALQSQSQQRRTRNELRMLIECSIREKRKRLRQLDTSDADQQKRAKHLTTAILQQRSFLRVSLPELSDHTAENLLKQFKRDDKDSPMITH